MTTTERIRNIANKQTEQLIIALESAYIGTKLSKKHYWMFLGDVYILKKFYNEVYLSTYHGNYSNAIKMMRDFDTDVRESIPAVIYKFLTTR